jgi:hypothetical protein
VAMLHEWEDRRHMLGGARIQGETFLNRLGGRKRWVRILVQVEDMGILLKKRDALNTIFPYKCQNKFTGP